MHQFAARALRLVSLALLCAPALHADQWTQPTKEELSMTSIPQVPGAPAVYLLREEVTDDHLHKWSVYVRLKVLTEKGKDKANVELSYGHQNGGGGGYTVQDIEGRTIHPDGTVVPFTGKPYEKLIVKTGGYQGYKQMAKVFTLPDVTVGSIIEYRYAIRYDDHYFIPPDWYIQSDLYLRKGHYNWKPTSLQLVSSHKGREQLTSSIAWFPVLPKGAEVKQTQLPPVNGQQPQLILDLNVQDVPPAPDEEYMPPLGSFTYRVLFYYTPYRTSEEYWKNEGKFWAKDSEGFIGTSSKISAAVQQLVTPSDTPDQKLRKIYAAVMEMENTNYTRERESDEEKASGQRVTHSAEDVLDHKRGSSDQLAMLFVAMARAANVKAYLGVVTNRSRSIFTPYYLSTNQLDDNIVIANLDGKDQYLDPGSRYCPYGHLSWPHTFAGGLREMDYGGTTQTITTPGESYSFSHVTRIADVTMDEHGEVSGIAKLTFTGSPALTWRHAALRGDSTSLNHDLEESLQKMLPGGVKISVKSVDGLTEYEKPLAVAFDIKGPIGAPTGKRLFLPSDLFISNEKATFPHESRESAVSFNYPSYVQDAFRVKLPASLHVESVPVKGSEQFEKYAVYSLIPEPTANSVTVRRNLAQAEILFSASEYPALRAFYNKMETKDQENIILTNSPAAAASETKPAGSN